MSLVQKIPQWLRNHLEENFYFPRMARNVLKQHFEKLRDRETQPDKKGVFDKFIDYLSLPTTENIPPKIRQEILAEIESSNNPHCLPNTCPPGLSSFFRCAHIIDNRTKEQKESVFVVDAKNFSFDLR